MAVCQLGDSIVVVFIEIQITEFLDYCRFELFLPAPLKE